MRITIIDKQRKALSLSVLAERVPAIYPNRPCADGRDAPGHDDRWNPLAWRPVEPLGHDDRWSPSAMTTGGTPQP
jgi:hypothetical protein